LFFIQIAVIDRDVMNDIVIVIECWMMDALFVSF